MGDGAGFGLRGRRKGTPTTARIALLCAASLIAVLFTAVPAHAATYTVNSTGDESDANTADTLCLTAAGTCTLRAAIQQANAAAGADVITFAIAGEGPHTIQPTSMYTVTSPVTIDGYSQPGATQNTLPTGTNATLKIEIDGRLFPGTLSIGFRFNTGSSGSTIRGLAVHSFQNRAIEILGSSGSNFVQGNFLGTDVSGTSRGANPQDLGVVVFGPNNTIGGNAAERNLISGNNYGIYLSGSTSTGNAVKGNLIGTSAAGTAKLPGAPSSPTGIASNSSANNNTIGGVGPVDGNVVSGQGYGVHLQSGTHSHVVKGNLIGTNAEGTSAVSNGTGVYLSGSTNNIIGGAEDGAGNVISGSNVNGLFLNTGGGNVVKGNLIGTNLAGTAAVPNKAAGIRSESSSNNTFGGSEDGARNVISGNTQAGVHVVYASTNNTFKGNRIGTNASATARIPNGGPGIFVGNQASVTSIGGTDSGAGNVLAANGEEGISVEFGGSVTAIQGNYIGTNPAGATGLGNAGPGIDIYESTVGAIGGSVTGAANVIKHNGGAGISVRFFQYASPTRIWPNSISQNGGLGIDLVGGQSGVTPNDPQDPDTGPNNLQNYPVLAATPGSTAIGGTLNSVPNGTFRIEFFENSACDPSGYGEGETYLGFQNVTADQNGNATINATFDQLAVGDVVTATAAQSQATSEFSKCVTLEPTPSSDLAVTVTDGRTTARVGETLSYRVVVTNNGPSAANGSTLTDKLPASVTYISSTCTSAGGASCAPNPPCTNAGGTVTCTIPTLPSGSSVTYVITVGAHTPGEVKNPVSVTVPNGHEEPNINNNTAEDTTTVVPNAYLSVTQTDNPDPARVGQDVTYTVSVKNNGPSDATGVVLTDDIPASATFVSATPSQGSDCTNDAGQITCDLGDLAKDASATVAIVVTPTSPGEITNTASADSVESDEADPSWTNDTDEEKTTVAPSADLSVTQTDTPDPALLGQDITYTVTVKNNGPSGATGVVLTDDIPASTSFVSTTPSQGTECTHDAGKTTCALGSLTKDATATVTIVVTPSATGEVKNTAAVDGNEADPVSTNDVDDETTTVNPSSDLEVTTTDSPDPARLGQDVTYTVTVKNNGPSDATGVVLTDDIPASSTFVSATPSQGSDCTHDAGEVTCALGSLAKDATATISIVVTPTSTGDITNTASVDGTEADAVSTNDSDDEKTTVNPSADLEIDMTDSPDPALVGQNVTYTLTVTNKGPSTTTGVEVTHQLTNSVDFVSATPSQGTCTPAAGDGFSTKCELGNLAKDATATITIVGTPTETGTVSSTATVANGGLEGPDPTPSNNTVEETTTVNASADLSVTTTDTPDPVLLGQDVTYTVTVKNNGPSDATGIVLTDDFPASTTTVSATPSQGSLCTQEAGEISCALGDLAKDATATVTIVVRPTSSGEITNTASVDGNEADPVSTNDSSDEKTIVSPSADLEVSQSDTPDPARVAQDITYTVTVKNNGPSDATGVVLTDTIPASVDFVSATPSQGGACAQEGDEISCGLGAIAKDGTATVTIVVTPTDFGDITNTASVDGTEADAVSSNDSDDETSTVEGTRPCGDDSGQWCTAPGDSDSQANGRDIRVEEGSGEVIIRGNRNLIEIDSEFEGTVEAVGKYNFISGSPRGDTITVKGCGNRVRARGGRDKVTVDCPAPGTPTIGITAPNGDRTQVTNVVWGGDGADIVRNLGDRVAFFGQVGADELIGGAFDDLIEGGDGEDKVSAGDGDDIVLGEAGDDDLNGGAGMDTVRGAGGADRVAGGMHNDSLFGGAGPDELLGGPGNDSLDGGPDSDSCDGGGGANTFTSC